MNSIEERERDLQYYLARARAHGIQVDEAKVRDAAFPDIRSRWRKFWDNFWGRRLCDRCRIGYIEVYATSGYAVHREHYRCTCCHYEAGYVLASADR